MTGGRPQNLTDEEILALYQKGQFIKQIVNGYHVGRKRVHRILDEHGLRERA